MSVLAAETERRTVAAPPAGGGTAAVEPGTQRRSQKRRCHDHNRLKPRAAVKGTQRVDQQSSAPQTATMGNSLSLVSRAASNVQYGNARAGLLRAAGCSRWASRPRARRCTVAISGVIAAHHSRQGPAQGCHHAAAAAAAAASERGCGPAALPAASRWLQAASVGLPVAVGSAIGMAIAPEIKSWYK